MSADLLQMTLPSLRDDIRIYGGPTEKDGSPTWTLYDPAGNRFFRIGWLEFECLSRLSKFTNLGELLEDLNKQTTLQVKAEDIATIINFLLGGQLARISGVGSDRHFSKRIPERKTGIMKTALQRYLFFMIPLLKPEQFLKKTLPLVNPLLTRKFLFLMMGILMLGIVLTINRIDEFLNTFMYFFTLDGALFYILTIIIVKIIHELAHAYIATKQGVRVTSMGIGFMVLYPVLYTETTGAWRLPDKYKRLTIGLGGVMAEFCIAAAALLCWHILPDGAPRSAAFFIATVSLVGSVLINLNPLMRFDGYYVLSDLLGVDNMQERAFALGKWRLRRLLFGKIARVPETFTPSLQSGLLIYAYATWIYRLFLFLGITWLTYSLFLKPLNLLLAGTVLFWFIAKPILSEIKSWFIGIRKMKSTIPIMRAVLLFGFLAGIAFIPWQTHISVPAVMQAQAYARIYSPFPAKVTEVLVKEQRRVETGDILVKLESPDLDYKIEQATQELQKLKSQRIRIARSQQLLQSGQVLSQRIAEASATLNGLKERKEQLNIRAPFNGIVADILPYLHEGRWIDDTQPLMQLVRFDQGVLIQGYVKENDLRRVNTSSSGAFYPDTDLMAPFPVEVTQISQTNATLLKWEILASNYGGPIAIEKNSESLVPHDVLYEVHLSPKQMQGFEIPLHIIRGHIKLNAEKRSLSQKALRTIFSLVIKETGF